MRKMQSEKPCRVYECFLYITCKFSRRAVVETPKLQCFLTKWKVFNFFWIIESFPPQDKVDDVASDGRAENRILILQIESETRPDEQRGVINVRANEFVCTCNMCACEWICAHACFFSSEIVWTTCARACVCVLSVSAIKMKRRYPRTYWPTDEQTLKQKLGITFDNQLICISKNLVTHKYSLSLV